MVRALLAGTKTQTRRTLNPQPTECPKGLVSYHGRHGGIHGTVDHAEFRDALVDFAARYAAGDRLWVREAWRTQIGDDSWSPAGLGPLVTSWRYEADGKRSHDDVERFGRFRASMHMPRWVSRLTLIVTAVKVERLQDISEADAVAEGIRPFGASGSYISPKHPDGKWRAGHNAYEMYRDLWNAINGAGSWDANPFVAAYTFTVHHQNVDQMEAA